MTVSHMISKPAPKYRRCRWANVAKPGSFAARSGCRRWIISMPISAIMVVSGRIVWTPWQPRRPSVSITLGLRGFHGDQTILPLTTMIALIGMLMIQRLHPDLAANEPGFATLAQRHLLYLGAGLLIMWLTDLLKSSWRVGGLKLPPIPYLVPMGVMWAMSLLTLVVLNDLGSALLFFGIFVSMLYVATGGFVYVVVGLGSFAAACYGAWFAFDRIAIRVQNWLNPWTDPLASGFQPVQSDYALASGGVFGVGFGYGSPTLIPEVQTDYIFSAIGEELGLLGALAVIALYLLFVLRGFTIAMRARDGYVQLLAAGLSSIIGIQTVIILGGVTRVIPLTGITLPLISYGGSALLTNFALAGVLLYISELPKRV